MRKKVYLLFVFALLLTGGTLAYTINYVLNTTTQHNVGVGNTVKTVDGLTVTVNNVKQGNLTYYALEESTTDKHTLTYTYDYTIHNGTYDVVVSSLSNDIVVVGYNVGDVITVEIALNQDVEFNTGDTINFTLLFELVEITLNGYTKDNPLNLNTATRQQLFDIGFTSQEADNLLMAGSSTPFADLADLAYRIGAPTLIDRYQKYEDAGVIVF